MSDVQRTISRVDKINNLLYEDKPKYDSWLKFILGGVLALTFILGIVLLFEDIVVAWVMFGTTLFDALLFKAILPRRFQIFEDRVRILLGWHLAHDIPFSNIVDARSASGNRAFAYWGIRFATSTRFVVEIVCKKGLNVIISPSKGNIFLEQLNHIRKSVPNLN